MRWNSSSYIVWHIDLYFSNEFSESQAIGAIFVKSRPSVIHTRVVF